MGWSHMKKKKDIATVISWFMIILGTIALFVYIFLKSFGVINTPIFVNYIPHMAGGLTLLGVAIQTGKVLQKIKHVESDFGKMDEKVGSLVVDVASIKTKVDAHDISIKTMDDRVVEIMRGDPVDRPKVKRS